MDFLSSTSGALGVRWSGPSIMVSREPQQGDLIS
jgi:hypothetical protein